MDPRRVLLIEALDAAGSSPADAAVRLEALARAGLEVDACVIDARPRNQDQDEAWAVPEGIPFVRDRRDLSAILDRSRDRLVIVASATPGGGPLARVLPPGRNARWWPTGLHPALASRPAAPWSRTLLPPLDARAEDGPAARPCVSAGLTWSVIEGPRGGRRRLAPWDGEYVLVPVAWTVEAATRALRLFADIAESHDSLDLVFLASPNRELVQEARRLGIGPRVHFAGPAPRAAEYAWCHAAAAVLLNGALPLAGGVALRALAGGAPVLVIGEGAMDRALSRWLEESSCAPESHSKSADSTIRALERLLERGPEVEAAMARGREVAALHHVEAMAPRLKEALRLDVEQRRRAA